MIERLGLSALRRLDPERAHGLALMALRAGLARGPRPPESARLRTRLFGRDLANPLGLAAGFDKGAVAVDAALAAGFGFVEVGAVTPRPQPGNPRPRLFRLSEDRAAINRFGFNSEGLEIVRARLAARRGRPEARRGLVGVNLGANKDSPDRAADYVTLIEGLRDLAGFLTVNVSSPNTEGLRGLQARAALDRLLGPCRAAAGDAPLAVKIAPDLTDAEIGDVAAAARAHGLDAIIATNTTLARDGLRSRHATEAGGLSGRPLFRRSTEVLRALRRLTRGEIALIGVGGVEDGETAYAKIRAGAGALQLYTALVYGGIGLGARLLRDLDARLERDGFARLEDAVGVDA